MLHSFSIGITMYFKKKKKHLKRKNRTSSIINSHHIKSVAGYTFDKSSFTIKNLKGYYFNLNQHA